jgi:hypothetical protein
MVSVGVSMTLLQSDVGKDEAVLRIAHWCRMSGNRQGSNASKRQPPLGRTSRYVGGKNDNIIEKDTKIKSIAEEDLPQR